MNKMLQIANLVGKKVWVEGGYIETANGVLSIIDNICFLTKDDWRLAFKIDDISKIDNNEIYLVTHKTVSEGAYVGGNINLQGGSFIGRDSTVNK